MRSKFWFSVVLKDMLTCIFPTFYMQKFRISVLLQILYCSSIRHYQSELKRIEYTFIVTIHMYNEIVKDLLFRSVETKSAK